MHAREMRLSHVVHYTHVSTVVAVIIRVICEITWCPNRPLKWLNEQQSLSETSYIVIERQLISY